MGLMATRGTSGLRIAGDTLVLGIVGDPIAQARSPLVINPKIAGAGANAVLVPIHLPRKAFDEGVAGLMRVANLGGLIFTLPFKERAMSLATCVGDVGMAVGAINALRREPDGTWSGDIFDGIGLVRALEAGGVAPEGRRVMLLGAGGAGSAIAISLALRGAAEIAVHDLEGARAERLVEKIRAAAPACRASVGAPSVEGRDLLVNATPVGMAPGSGMPAPFAEFPPSLTVFDIVPSAEPTPLLSLGARCGCTTFAGNAMVEGQADALLDFFRVVTE